MDAVPPKRFWKRVVALESHHRFLAALAIGVGALLLGWPWSLPIRITVAWDAYALCWLGLALTRMTGSNPQALAQVAKQTHFSRKLVFLLVLTAACASLTAVAFLLLGAKELKGARLGCHVTLAIGTVMLSWLVVHTIFALQYAYLYFRKRPTSAKSSEPGGLDFPGGDGTMPLDYGDFAYFSFVIGMTSQVSDVQISSPEIRRWALVHGIVSFGFNTAVLALSINIVSGLL